MTREEKTKFIEFMIGCGVLKFGEFITKSGRKTPYFINSGNYNTGRQIKELSKGYAQLIKNSNVDFDAMFGPAYKGIPLVTATASEYFQMYGIDKPYFFNRKEIKDHGEGGNIVGYTPKDHDKIIIIEDVITAGTAIGEVIPVLNSLANIKCSNMYISVNRRERGSTNAKTAIMEVNDKYGISVHSIIDVVDIRDYIKNSGKYEKYLTKMDNYMSQYCII